MTTPKRYPFNMNKHQHNLYYRYEKLRNEYDDRLYSGNITAQQCEKYEALIDALGKILDYGTGIVWLTGKEYALARDTAAWAEIVRP